MRSSRIIVGTLLLCVLFYNTSAAQITAQEQKAAEIISVLEMTNNQNGDGSSQDSGVQPVVEIGDDISTLKSQLEADQVVDDTNYQEDKIRIDSAIQALQDDIALAKVNRQAAKDKQTALNNERALIENIYQSDHQAYLNRIAQQADLVSTLDELIQTTQDNFVNNQGDAQPDTDAILASIKQIGKGHPMQVFAQMMSLFSESDAQDLIGRFQSLEQAVQESQKIDSEKEDYNQELYSVLSNDLDNVLLPQVQELIDAYNAQIKQDKVKIADLIHEFEVITDLYQRRQVERANAIGYSTDAYNELQSDLDELIKTQVYVTSK